MNIFASFSSSLSLHNRFISTTIGQGKQLLTTSVERFQRKWTQLNVWPAYLAGALAVASSVAMVASIMMNNIPLTLLHGFLSLGSSIIAIKLPSYIPLKRLEEQVNDVERNIRALNTGIASISLTAGSLETTRRGFKADLEENKTRTHELSETLQTHDEILISLQTRMASVQEALDRTHELKTTWEDLSKIVSDEITSFQHIVERFTARDISTSIEELTHVSQSLVTQVSSAGEFLIHVKQARAEWLEFLKTVTQKFTDLQREVEEKKSLLQRQEAILVQLRAETQGLESTIKQQKPLVIALQEMSEQYQKAQKELDELDHEIQLLLSLPPTATLEEAQAIAERARKVIKEKRGHAH